MTFASLHMFGKVPCEKDLFINSVRGMLSSCFAIFRTLVVILKRPTRLLLFNIFMISIISSGVVEVQKKISVVGFFR